MASIVGLEFYFTDKTIAQANNIPHLVGGFYLIFIHTKDALERIARNPFEKPTFDLTTIHTACNKLQFIYFEKSICLPSSTKPDFAQIAGLSNIQFPPSLEKIRVNGIKHPLFNYYPPNLLELTISGCSLEAIPTNLPKSLTRLILSGNDIKGAIMLDIKAHFPNLTYLDLSNNKIDKIGFISISDKLTTVRLNDNKITDAGFICAPMEEVQLANNAIAKFPENLPSTLKTLLLHQNQISEIPLEFIKRRLNDEVNFRLMISNNHSMLINFTEFNKLNCIVYMLATLLDLKNISTLEQLQNKLNNPIFDLLKDVENTFDCRINDTSEHVFDDVTREYNETLYERDADIVRQMEKQYGRLMMYINVLCAVVIGLCAYLAYLRI